VLGGFNLSSGAGFVESTAPMDMCPPLLLMTKVGGRPYFAERQEGVAKKRSADGAGI
jgi:hypothetical protein